MTQLEQDFKDFYAGDDTKARLILNRLEPRLDDQYSQETVDTAAVVACLVLRNNPEIDRSKGIDMEKAFDRLKEGLKVR